ncbi:TonB-dependent receptor [Haliea sp. E17]|uniref:TonB-dependent receptor n=1 Tax=Haliea sp. E17 TaxID=3401576 RepID=UPI003AAB46AE
MQAPAVLAQEGSGERGLALEEVVVTARRREEFLQDVPASLTVFNQRQINDANITNPSDLATYTPNLSVNNRFGGDNTTFAIRGFSQELRTTASVGVYFAEVVALRGANSQQSGDGATPGDLFDLENVQVLKGPTGTLFGRNTTGGAVLLTPKRPTDDFEGYVEGSAGNFDMLRGQAVLNLPVTESFKLRLGVDHSERDGYLNNISGIGPDDFADQDYTAWRASALWEITGSLENYTIVRGVDSSNNGYPGSVFGCNPNAPLAFLCTPDLEEREANGDNGFYDVYSFVPKPVNEQNMWQAINTTTWEISDAFLVKNILAYGELETKQRGAVFGTNWSFQGEDLIFQQVGLSSGFPTTDQETLVEELQIQGSAFDDALSYQAGVYYEHSEPGSDYGAQSPAIIACDQASITGSNPDDFRCNNLLLQGALQSVPGGVEYTNMAVYAQATYSFTDTLSITGGLRYTDDETKGHTEDTVYYFPRVTPGTYAPPNRVFVESRNPTSESDEPTWLVGLDYTPSDDLLLYGKYNRGYRQGSVNIGGSTGADIHGPETVDTYEIGSKFSFHGAFPGTLNIAAFYNDFQDQQVQYGYFKAISNVGTTAIINAGASTIYGAEVEATVQLTESLILNASYAYLNTKIDDLEFPNLVESGIAVPGTISNTTQEGDPLSFAPENSAVVSAIWMLPTPVAMGDMRLSATWVYTDEQQAVTEASSPPFYLIDSYDLWNFNFSWNAVMGSPIDFSAFMTNAFDEEYVTYVSGLYNSGGLESGQVGMPRMYGARFRYNFGM